jgi:hypothetical protein
MLLPAPPALYPKNDLLVGADYGNQQGGPLGGESFIYPRLELDNYSAITIIKTKENLYFLCFS